MNRIERGGLRAALVVLAAACTAGTLGGCVSDEGRVQRIHDLDQVVAEQRRKNDEMRALLEKAKKDVELAQAAVDRLQGRDAAYQDAQAKLQERIQELEKSFQAPGGGGQDGGIAIEKIAGGFKLVVQGEILFGTGEADLTSEGNAALEKIAGALKGRTERVRVEGHTDNVPIVKAETKSRYPFGNLDLSLDRALRVADALVKAGIEAKRVSCGGYGEHQPRTDNGSAEGRKKNRRVEILVQAE
jgi:chemotaxis protein MotB